VIRAGCSHCGGNGGEVKNLAATTVEHKGIFIGFRSRTPEEYPPPPPSDYTVTVL